jgi:hypothetical protein
MRQRDWGLGLPSIYIWGNYRGRDFDLIKEAAQRVGERVPHPAGVKAGKTDGANALEASKDI